MTLNTTIYITQTTATPLQVFAATQHFLARFDDHGRTADQHVTRDGEAYSTMDADPGLPPRLRRANIPQDLPACLDIEYRPHGHHFRTTSEHTTHNKYCQPTCDGTEDDNAESHKPACIMEVSFDTANGYKGPTFITEDGTHTMSCTDLHAVLIVELGNWLDTQHDGDWSWRNEYTGNVHHRYEGLTEFTGLSSQQQDWWLNLAKPAITQHIKEIASE